MSLFHRPDRKTDPILAILAEVALFRQCSPQELRAVTRICTIIDVETGAVLMEQGAKGMEAFVVVEGTAEVEIDGDVVATVGPGEPLGELALLDRGPRTGTVRATTPMRVLVLSAQEFGKLLHDHPAVTRLILRATGARLRTVGNGRETAS